LTCWFACFGPYARTTIDGLLSYYDRELAALAGLGCPVDPEMFFMLLDARSDTSDGSLPGEPTGSVGVSIPIDTSGQPIPDQPVGNSGGFERLRDVVTLWVPKTRSCGDLVLVDEPAEQVASLDHGSDPR
jgi:hypothetical protein